MNNNEFYEVGLYEHNANSYRKVREAYEKGENIVGIVHATGTGKTYIAEQLAKDNKDKKILWVVPNNSIVEHIENVIFNNPYLSREVDFKNVEFRTYQSFINMTREELENIDCDLLILDEFHHLGAPVWGSRINTIVDTHPNMKVFGMTAYTVRDRGTPFERDMANPDGGELFSGKIVSRYDLVDAMLDGVLPRDVIYRTSYTNLFGLEAELEDKIQKMKVTKEELEEYKKILATVKKRIAEAPGIADVVKKYVKSNGKYFYFCPPRSEEGTNDINTIMKEAYEWFSSYVPEEDIVFYSTTSEMREEGRHNREMFYNDLTLDGKDAKKKLRVMFAINQYNEGVHAPNVDGVIMGRGTSSDIVYFEQLGRSLAVRGNTYEKYKEYSKYSYDELVILARDKEISISSDISKEDIIEKLVSPVIIDLTNNIGFIKELEDNIKHRVRERREKGVGTRTSVKLRDVSFDIDIFNEDLYTTLSSLRNKIYKDWDSMYELAKKYYEYHGNLKIKRIFRTLNGYEHDDNGSRLGTWINNQRDAYKKGKLSQERIDKLNKIEMVFSVRQNDLEELNLGSFEKMITLAMRYYTVYRHLDVPIDFKTNDGVYYDENGYMLGAWLRIQKIVYNDGRLDNSRKYELEKNGMIFNNSMDCWKSMYKKAEEYYKKHGNLNIYLNYMTKDGYFLGAWLYHQKHLIGIGKLEDVKVKYLKSIGVVNGIRSGLSNDDWDLMYELATNHYNKYGNLSSAFDERFITSDGINDDYDGFILGVWLVTQKKLLEEGKLSQQKENKLYKIGLVDKEKEKIKILINLEKHEWDTMYLLTSNYYEKHGNLNVPLNYKTFDGIKIDTNGIPLGKWVSEQKSLFNQGKLSDRQVEQFAKLFVLSDTVKKQISLLKKCINKNEEWDLMYKLVKNYNDEYDHLHIPSYFLTMDGINYAECGYPLGKWLEEQKQLYLEDKLSTDQVDKLYDLGTLFSMEDTTWYNSYRTARRYYELHGNLNVPYGFVTSDGINESKDGINLNVWIRKQVKDLTNGNASSYKIEKLREIGISQEKIKKQEDTFFEEMYKITKEFYEKNWHVNPLVIENSKRKLKLRSPEENAMIWWVLDCKRKYYKELIDEDTYKRLKDIGVFMTDREAEWINMFRIASEFYNNYGHLDVPFGFKTFDGIKHDDEGLELGKWIRNQRINLKNEDRINKLNAIGMIWIVRTDTEETKDICLRHGIDYKENKNIIKRIPKIEFISKSNYLLANGYSIIIDGKLHEIYSMSNVDIKQKYGLSLEEIINNYYTIENKKKGL